MSNHVSYQMSGEIPLRSEVTEGMVDAILTGAQGDWDVFEADDAVFCSYTFWGEGNWSCNGPDHDALLDRLVSEGYTLAAWRESEVGGSENAGTHHHSRLRGTEEQKRQFRLQEIDQAIARLQAERAALLSGDGLV